MPARRHLLPLVLCLLSACPEPEANDDHGPVAENTAGPIGSPVPFASEDQLATFERGRAVALRRFSRAEGLGPAFNVTFCASCHERPTVGGSAGLYRNFFIGAVRLDDGSVVPTESAGPAGGVIRMYYYGDEEPSRPVVPPATNVIAHRNPIPFFGVGLLAEVPEEEVLKRADPDDRDGDGISGRPNYDRGFVGRFGRKSQTVSLEGFIRGPLFNHVGITSRPLTEDQKAALPVDSSGGDRTMALSTVADTLTALAQASAPDVELFDEDGAADPELSPEELFDLVSFAMLLAAPEFDDATEQTRRGMAIFNSVGCDDCHAPRLQSPRGPIAAYSDLLLHDMGEELADGLFQGDATGSEFRTQPLWGLTAVGPYLHDGRASTVEEAIRLHGGEGSAARDRFVDLSDAERADLLAFLGSLGGQGEYSPGLLPPGEPVPAVGAYGGPLRALSAEEQDAFVQGRALFDRDFQRHDGVGAPRLNGDSCRACHFDPVIGGSGPQGVNVMRHGIINEAGEFVVPSAGTILHKETIVTDSANLPQPEANHFEHRQTPHLFGLGLIESISEETILANADPDDTVSPDGISGRPSRTDGGRLGRFGWKAQVPSIEEFVRDAATAELGMTVPFEEGRTFGRLQDNDDVADPELGANQISLLAQFLGLLAPPPRQPISNAADVEAGESIFSDTGCALCHLPSLEGAGGPVPLYSDLLLHEILAEGALGIEDASASMREFRTAPLWGLSQTAPYLHTGAADTIEEAIVAHDGEAAETLERFQALTDEERRQLLSFLESL